MSKNKFVFEMDAAPYVDISINGNYLREKCRFEEFKILNAIDNDTKISLNIILGKDMFFTKPNNYLLDSKMFKYEYEKFISENKIDFPVSYFMSSYDNTIVNWQTSGPLLLHVARGEDDKYNQDLRIQVTGYYDGYVDSNKWSLDAFKETLLNNSSITPPVRKFEFVTY